VNFTYNGSICSDLNLIKNFIDEILNKLDKAINDDETLFDIRIILNELVINGVLHGNESVNTKCVDLALEVKNRQVKIEVKDEGVGINFDFESYDPEELKFGGRGLVLVRGLSDELYIDKNKIIAIKNLNKGLN
jgi:serine/threonine-protein kinase RsbW